MIKLLLNGGWRLRFEDLHLDREMVEWVLQKEKGWMETDIPCDVHMPLLKSGLVNEPLEADFSYSSEWIENKSWWFKKDFIVDAEILESDVAELTLESLDAEADVFVNGVFIGHQKSAFYPFQKDIRHLLKSGNNQLAVRITTGVEYVSEYQLSPFKQNISTEADANRGDRGDKRRVYVRKPQYVFGWDWGPRVATCGIMKDVYICAYKKLAVRNVHTVTKSIGKDALLTLILKIENFHPYSTAEAEIKVDLLDGSRIAANVKKDVLLRSGLNYIELDVEVKDVKLWWPNGMGSQFLYTVNASVVSEGYEYSYSPFKIGVRTLTLKLDKINSSERKFNFVINGVDMFCKGGNWIPADSIYARVTDSKYETLISEANNAGFNMLRIWGGGLYEKDIFYEKCNEYGILIWHDFMFVCALYPDHEEWFRNEVEKELDYQTQRLRTHPCLALWCGNNEIHWFFDDTYIGDKKPPFLGGVICYNEMAPDIVHRNCPEIPYWNSSPYGGKHPNCNEVGDRHHWHDCMMNPVMEKRITPEEYDLITSKFISEYGYVGPCRKSSILQYYGGEPVDRTSRVWELHNNTFEKATVPAGIRKHYTDPEGLDLDQYLLYAGLCQGLMLGYSLESLRFKEGCSGSLFWMYNDCWGEVGWSIIDYYLKRKISYYFVKRAFMPLKLILREKDAIISVVGINDTAEAVSFDAEYGYTSFDGCYKNTSLDAISLQPHSRNVILRFPVSDFNADQGLFFVKPLDNNLSIYPGILKCKEFRTLKIPESNLTISDIEASAEKMSFTVSSLSYSHAVHFNLDDSILLSDEYFDLLPGESRRITAFNNKNTKIPEIEVKTIFSEK